MVSLTLFLIIWIVCLAIYGILVLVTLLQMLRHGLPTPSSYITTFIFLLVMAGVVIGTSMYLTGVDWSVAVNVVPEDLLPFFFGV